MILEVYYIIVDMWKPGVSLNVSHDIQEWVYLTQLYHRPFPQMCRMYVLVSLSFFI